MFDMFINVFATITVVIVFLKVLEFLRLLINQWIKELGDSENPIDGYNKFPNHHD